MKKILCAILHEQEDNTWSYCECNTCDYESLDCVEGEELDITVHNRMPDSKVVGDLEGSWAAMYWEAEESGIVEKGWNKFINVEMFEKWLTNNLKYDFLLDEHLEKLEEHLCNIGATPGYNSYELDSFSTKSGNPECIGFKLEEEYYDENGNIITFDDEDIEYHEYYKIITFL